MKYILPLLALTALPLSAQTVSPDAAETLARQFFTAHAVGPNRAPAKVDPVLSYTASTAGTPDFYVFNRAADAPGFVIVNAAATAEATPILGYSETSTFDYDTAPDNFRWWLEQYQQNGVAKAPAQAPAGRHDVGPLVKTQWGQDEPYNNAIPRLSPRVYPFVTGCTATAMAQIMNVYEYPTSGKGSKSYQLGGWELPNGEVATPTFEANFESAHYDWANMLDDYSDGYTTAQGNAVAQLMYHAGVAERAEYGYNQYGNAETSADDRSSGKALIEHFRYSPSMLRGERDYFNDEEWASTIYNELAEGRPVMYSGSTPSNEGHCFVCDGYRASDGFFHMNWGWNGTSDGYFALSGAKALKPGNQGTGGAASGGGFTESQSINYNILATEAGEYAVQACVWGNFTVGTDGGVTQTFSSRTIDRAHGGDIPVYMRLGSYNNGFFPFIIKSGVILRHTTTGLTFPQKGFDADIELNPSQMVEYSYTVGGKAEYAHFNTSTAPYNGTYEILPACTTDNGATWHTMRMLATDVIPTITIVGGEDAEAVELPFTLSANQVEVGKTVIIAPHNDYTGIVTYTSSDPAVASVTAEGVVTGIAEGHVTITATSGATTAFLATTKVFEIDVVGHIMHDVNVSISKTALIVDETANITVTPEYEGEVTYSVAPAGIVSVSPAGVVTALAEGDATITVNVVGDADYNAVTKHFEVTVSNVPPAPVVPGFCMDSYPYVGENNIVTSSNMTLHIPLYNSSASEIYPATFYVLMNCDDGPILWTCGFGRQSYPVGYKYDYTLDPIEEECIDYFTPGNVYTYEFYLDVACTKPMNVPSLTYYYCPDTPSVATLTSLIDNAQKGNGATPKLIKTLASKLIGK